MEGFRKEVIIRPAFDRRHQDPNKNYGIAACKIHFVLIGPLGATQFVVGTNWYLPEVWENDRPEWPVTIKNEYPLTGWDVGCHARKPQYEGQDVTQQDCEFIGGPCYYDGSSRRADTWIPHFVAGGTDWLWKKLEEDYREQFEGIEGSEP